MEFIGGLANNGGMSLQDELATLLILVSEARRKDLERMREEEAAPGNEELRRASLQQAQRKWACIRQEVLKGLLGDRESAKMVRALFACRYPFLGVLCYEDVTASRQRRAEIVEAENIKLYGCASSLRGGDTPPSSSDTEEEVEEEEEEDEEKADTAAGVAVAEEAEQAGDSLVVPVAPVVASPVVAADGGDVCRALSDVDSIDDIYRDSIAGHDNNSFDHDEYEEADDGESGVLVEGLCFRSSSSSSSSRAGAAAAAAAPPPSCVVGVLCAAAAAVAAAKEGAAAAAAEAAERGLVEEAAAAAAAAAAVVEEEEEEEDSFNKFAAHFSGLSSASSGSAPSAAASSWDEVGESPVVTSFLSEHFVACPPLHELLVEDSKAAVACGSEHGCDDDDDDDDGWCPIFGGGSLCNSDGSASSMKHDVVTVQDFSGFFRESLSLSSSLDNSSTRDDDSSRDSSLCGSPDDFITRGSSLFSLPLHSVAIVGGDNIQT